MKSISRQIKGCVEQLTDGGMTPGYIVLSLANYQALMTEFAAADRVDHLQAHDRYLDIPIVAIPGDDIVEVVPNVLEMWEEGDYFASPIRSETEAGRSTIADVRFAEL